MDGLYRRVILKPPDLTDRQSAQLRDLLSAAVQLQNELAGKSAHVVRFTGELKESDAAFWVEHELAEPVPLAPLFDPSVPGAAFPELLDATAALLDALRVAHQTRVPRALSHGGLCPGVLLKAPGGILKVTDFDFARALQTVLGIDAYLCLAVGPPRIPSGSTLSTALPEGASGVWEVVPPDITDRDDRLCAFIDPYKHSNQSYEGFESKSDMVAAGALLFLMAEHRHPYFYGDPAAHRSIDTATQIVLPSPFRRADLKEPDALGMQTWCQVVRRMVALDWEKRPTAEEALKTTGVAPVDPRGIVIRQIEELTTEALDKGLDDLVWWAQAIDSAEQLAACPELPPERARDAEAVALLGRAIGLMGGLDWERSEDPIRRILALTGIPPELAEKARSIEVLRQRCLSARERLDTIERELAALESMPLRERSRRLDQLEKTLEELFGAHLLPLLGERLRPIPHGLSARRALLSQQIEEVRAEAGVWLTRASEAFASGRWDELAALLESPPPAAEFDEAVAGRVGELRQRLAEHREQERLRREREADLAQRLAEAGRLIDSEALVEARARLEGADTQGEFPDFAEQARALLVRITERERELEARRESRARADALLQEATSRIAARSPADLSEAERLVDQVLQTEGRSDAQAQRAEQLRHQIGEIRRQIQEAWRRQKEKALGELGKAQARLGDSKYREAEASAAQLVDFEDPEIAHAARAILEDVGRRRLEAAEGIAKLLSEAREWLEAGELDAAGDCVAQASDNPLAGADHLSAAHRLNEQIQAARRAVEHARRQAATQVEQARSLLQAGDFLSARGLAEPAMANAHAEAGVKQQAQALLDAIAPLADAQDLIAQKDYPAAIRVLDNLLAAGSPLPAGVQEAGQGLRARAVQERGQAEVTYLLEHLNRRAEREEKSGFVRTLPIEQSIGPDCPEWAGQSLRSVETFLGDWVDTHTDVSPDPATKVLAPQHRFGEKYEIVRAIGRGGMGEVYLARDVMLDRLVALKLAPSVGDLKDLAEHLQIEAKAIARLDYPKHILRINSFGASEGRYYFDTDYKEAPNLAEYAKEHGPLSHRRVAEILIPVAEALDYAHGKGIYHRDIKPTNILVGRQPGEGPWLIDFGLARISSICHQRARQGLCGTPGYMAPEVIRSMGREVDDRAADIFSLGCVLYELLTGELPYQNGRGPGRSQRPESSSSMREPPRLGTQTNRTGAGPESLTRRRPGVARMLLNTLQGQPMVLDERIPSPLREVCRRALAPDPRDRYAAAEEVSAALAAFVRDLDRRDVEERLARARQGFETRRRNQPEELHDLDDARRQAEAIPTHVDTRLTEESQRLLSEIAGTRRQIEDTIEQARGQLASAQAMLDQGQFSPAVEAAQAVLDVGYVPDLHEQAATVIEEAQRRRRERLGRVKKTGGIAAAALVVVGAIAIIIASRPDPPDRNQSADPVKSNTGAGQTTIAPAQLVIDAAAAWSVAGPRGGPFQPMSRVYGLSNRGGSKLAWTATIQPTQKWLQIPKPTGELEAGATGTLSVSLTAETEQLAPGAYSAEIVLTDAEKKEWKRLPVTLQVAAEPGALAVTPQGTWSSEVKDGVFTPAAFSATLENTGGMPLEWTAQSSQPWLTIEPSKGVLAKSGEPGASGKVTVTITELAKTLTPNEYSASLTFSQDGKVPPGRPLTLKLVIPAPPGVLAVTPQGTWRSELQGGVFTPASFTARLDNTGGMPVRWTARSAEAWLQLEPAEGTLAKRGDAGATAQVTITIQDRAKQLTPGEYSASAAFTQDGKPLPNPPSLKLVVPLPPGLLKVTPEGTWTSVLKDGSFAPASLSATLENVGGSTLHWKAQASEPWLRLEPQKGTLARSGEPDASGKVTITFTDQAKRLTPGAYNASLTLTQDDKPLPGQPLALKLTIPPPPGLLTVTPQGAWSSELKGGAFTPASFTARLENTGGAPLNWAAHCAEGWLRIEPEKGTLAPRGDAGATVQVSVTITDQAKKLEAMQHTANISFSQDGQALPHQPPPLKLTIPAAVPIGGAVWPAKRAALEQSFPAATGDIDAATAYDLLRRIAAVKYMRDQTSMTQQQDLTRWTAHVQTSLAARGPSALKITPYRFIEYFWGENVHALCWYSSGNAPPAVRYYRLTSGAGGAAALPEAELGDKLIRPILADSLSIGGRSESFVPQASLDSFGIAIAPDGPLVFKGVERLRFLPLALPELIVKQEPDMALPKALAGPVSMLADVSGLPASGGDNQFSHTAVWVLPTLGGAAVPAPTSLSALYQEMYQSAWTAARGGADSLAVTRPKPGELRNGMCLHSAADRAATDWISTRRVDLNPIVPAGFLDAAFFGPRLFTDGAPPALILLSDPVP